MGKRNKGEQKDNIVKTKKKRSENNAVANDAITEEISIIESTGNGKNKKILFDNDEYTKMEPDKKIAKEPNTTSAEGSQNKRTRFSAKNMESNKTKQNKKKIFIGDNDEGTEVTVNKMRKIENGSDEEPGEEEIDKFCDELDEEDNKQYEKWVKLLEAKLGPNKKK